MPDGALLALLTLTLGGLQALALFILAGIRADLKDLRDELSDMAQRVATLEGARRRAAAAQL